MEDIEATSIAFIEETLGLPMYEWQRKAVEPLDDAGWGMPIVQISLLAPNEAGKSSRVVAGSALYWISVWAKGKVAITTKDQKQLNEQIIPAIEGQLHKLGGFKSVRSPYYRVTTPTGGLILAYVTDDSNRVEGLHGSPDAPLLEIVDEAKSVQESIFQGIDRCGYQAILYCSSGGLMQGTFYNTQTKFRDKWHCVAAGLKDCPHISPAKVQRIIDKWGENHPFTRSCVYGEFMEQDDEVQFCITHSALRAALENPPRHRPGMKVAFTDFAEGNAEYVVALRDGNKTTIVSAFREANKNAACAKLIRCYLDNGLVAEQIWGDAADKEAREILASMGWIIHAQNFGAKAKQDEIYSSWSAEAWIDTGIAITKGELIVPDDEILFAQLVARKKEMVGRGKWAAEEKYEMRKRGIESPDRGDAYCGAQNIYPINMVGRFNDPSMWEDSAPASSEFSDVMKGLGAHAGV